MTDDCLEPQCGSDGREEPLSGQRVFERMPNGIERKATRGVPARGDRVTTLVDASLEAIENEVEAAVFDEPGQGIVADLPVWIALRRGGRSVRSAWRESGRLSPMLRSVWAGVEAPFDRIELVAVTGLRPVAEEDWDPEGLADARGVLGLAMAWGGRTVRVSPTRMLARNRGFAAAFEGLCTELGCSPANFWAEGGTLNLLEARQLFVRLDEERGVSAVPVFRGQTTIPLESINAAATYDMALAMADWLRRHCDEQGRLTYSWHPSRGGPGAGDNAIRRFMGVRALGLLARHTGMPDDAELARRALRHLLNQTCREDNRGIGSIRLGGSVKLGALALAALAILDSPEADEHADVLAGLWRGIDALSGPDGSFRTFAWPPGRNDNQNFYPGEALYAWAKLLQSRWDDGLAKRFALHAEAYKKRFEARPNPAFVPWHTLARCTAIDMELDPNGDSADFVFAMNDWLAGLQQWTDAPYPDLRGRFYAPERPDYGPPHASSTGVYLEGLIAAWRLARSTGDTWRAERYAECIRRSLRSLRQLQYRDGDSEAGFFHLTERLACRGGVRTEVWDNRIRLDNVQHALTAILDLVSEPDGLTTLFPLPAPIGRFRLLDEGLSLVAIRHELASNAALWEIDRRRQTNLRVQRNTQSIVLRGPQRPVPDDIDQRDWHLSAPTEHARAFPQLMAGLERIAASCGRRLARTTIVRLRPGSRVHRHCDAGAYYRARDRFHAVLESPQGSPMIAGGETVTMREGEVWWLDNKVPHEALNPGPAWRVHAIFDLEPA